LLPRWTHKILLLKLLGGLSNPQVAFFFFFFFLLLTFPCLFQKLKPIKQLNSALHTPDVPFASKLSKTNSEMKPCLHLTAGNDSSSLNTRVSAQGISFSSLAVRQKSVGENLTVSTLFLQRQRYCFISEEKFSWLVTPMYFVYYTGISKCKISGVAYLPLD
jgi:hypothetical protein